MSTIQSTRRSLAPARRRLIARPCGAAALALVSAEIAFALAGTPVPLLSAGALLLAPGLVLVPLLPRPARSDYVTVLAAVPALGLAGSCVLLITASAVGIPLEPAAVRALLAGFVITALVVPLPPERVAAGSRPRRLLLLCLTGVLLVGLFLQERVIGGYPVPGNDWAKYLLYADEIRRQGSLLIDNPFWFLGIPFLEDPGVPSIYGSYLVLGGQETAVLAHGIWVFAVAGILSMFAFVRAFWGDVAAVLAAGFWAAMPMSHDILGWHGLANVAALALLPILLLYVVSLISGGATRPEAAGLGLMIVSLAAVHRFSFVVGMAAMGAGVGVMLLTRARRNMLRRLVETAGFVLLVGAGVLYDLMQRSEAFGGYQNYEAYLSQKVMLEPVLRSLTLPFTAASLLAVALAFVWAPRDRRLVPLLALVVVVVALAYAWVVHLPLFYIRMAYFLPLALAPILAAALTRLVRPRHAALLGAALVLAMAGSSYQKSDDVRGLYEFTTPESLRGLDALAERLRPGEVVVTDRCWSFLATWLLRAKTLAALEPADIQPKAEVVRAAQARQILAGTPEGQRLARDLGVRYLVVNPACTDSEVRPLTPPVIGDPLDLQRNIVILELPEA